MTSTAAPTAADWQAAGVEHVPELTLQLLETTSLSDAAALEMALQAALGTLAGDSAPDNAKINAIIDALWWWNIINSDGDDESAVTSHQTAVALVRALHQAGVSTDRLVQDLSAPVLARADLVPSEADLAKKTRLLNTTLHYRQEKYNLLSEASQGYAQLLVLLSTTCAVATTTLPDQGGNDNGNDEPMHAPLSFILVNRVQDLVCAFQLDPHRVLDLTLDVLHQHDNDDIWQRFVPLLQSLPRKHLANLLAFKLSYHTEEHHIALYALMTWLVQHDLLTLTSMLRYLPDDWMVTLDELHARLHEQYLANIKALASVRLGTGAAGAADEPTVPVDTQPLRNCRVICWLETWIGRASASWLAHWQPVLQHVWSRLCAVLPHVIGTALCDALAMRLEPFAVALSPWTKPDSVKNMALDKDGLQECLRVEIIPYLLETFSSGCIALRPHLYVQVCRLLSALSGKTAIADYIIDFIRDYLLPSLTLFPSNPALNMDVWNVLQLLPWEDRYQLYAAWRGTGLDRAALRALTKPRWQIAGELQAAKDIKYHLKRLAKDTVRDASRAVAKICHGQPLVVFTTLLSQIEAYDNMIGIMIDVLRFCTPLALEVLTFCVVGRLSGEVGGMNRNRLKEDGINVSQWLQSLETFTGTLYKRYPELELRGILNYLMSRLKDGHVMEVGVLRTLLKTGAGWAYCDYAPAASLSSSQLQGRAGSMVLKREAMTFGVAEDINPRAAAMIRNVLQTSDTGVILLILLAQLKHQVVFGKAGTGGDKPIKLVGYLVDTCQVVVSMLLDFLTSRGTSSQPFEPIRRYARSLPAMATLFDTYKLDVASCWMLCRPLIRAASSEDVEDEADTDLMEALAKFRTSELDRDDIRKMAPTAVWNTIQTSLFECFYGLKLYDLHCPEFSYEMELSRLDREKERLDKALKSPQAGIVPREPSAVKKDRIELDRVIFTISELKKDLASHRDHVTSIKGEVKARSERLVADGADYREVAVIFLTQCVYPRCTQGPDDALYCAYFVQMMLNFGTPRFSIVHLLDILFPVLSRSLFGLTEDEAANVAILLTTIWAIVSKWRYNEEAFNAELRNKEGGLWTELEDGETKTESVSYRTYEVLYNKWHMAIGSAALGCLKSKEYIHTRNSLILLTRMVDTFPTQPLLGTSLLSALEPLQDEGCKFADIRASAQAYSTQLSKARDDGVWTEEDAATKKARAEKDTAAAAARQKRAVEQMEEIKRESAKITEEIGEWDGRRGDRGRPMDRGDYGRPVAEARDVYRPPLKRESPPRDEPRRHEDTRRQEERERLDDGPRDEPRRHDDVRRPDEMRRHDGMRRDQLNVVRPPHDAPHREPPRDDRRGPLSPPIQQLRDGPDRDDRWPRDRESSRPELHTAISERPPPSRRELPRQSREDDRRRSFEDGPRRNLDDAHRRAPDDSSRRGLEGRWTRPEDRNAGRSAVPAPDRPVAGSKRSRPASPNETGESSRQDDNRASKRARSDDDVGPNRADDGGKGGRSRGSRRKS